MPLIDDCDTPIQLFTSFWFPNKEFNAAAMVGSRVVGIFTFSRFREL